MTTKTDGSAPREEFYIAMGNDRIATTTSSERRFEREIGRGGGGVRKEPEHSTKATEI